MEMLTSRQKTILNSVIDVHVETAHPVGSRLVTERYSLQYSSATVRNEMGFLENAGYLTHPHTSSGRIPTDFGYRYYVDHCLDQQSLGQPLAQPFAKGLSEPSEEIESFGDRVSRILASLSEEVSVVMVSSDDSFGKGEPARQPKLFLQGSTHILEKPEFQDIQKVRMLFRVFEEKMKLADWLSQQGSDDNVSVSIGRENEPEALQDCAVVMTRYSSARGKLGGTLAIIGPKRMRYPHTIALVRQMAHGIHQIPE